MIIFDLDGTLADITHRRPLVDKTLRGSQNWPEFYRQCVNDKPLGHNIGLLKCLYYTTPVSKLIEIWSGRSDEVRTLTFDWLQKHVFMDFYGWRDPDGPMYIKVRMRPAGDNTPDATLKERWLDEALAEGYNVEMVFDDRQRVVDMWRRRGIPCLQVAEGNF